MFERIKTILIKEFLQIFRDPRMRFTIFVPPIIQVLVFGYAATMDITHVPTAVYDKDNTKESRQIIRDFSYSQYFDINYNLYEEKQARELIDKFKVISVLKIDRQFARNLVGNRSAELQLILDGTDCVSFEVLIFFSRKQCPQQSFIFLSQRVSAITF